MPLLTRSDLVDRIGDLTQDPSHQEWTAAKKQDKLQEAQERFVLDTRVLVDTVTDTAVDGTSEYSLQSDVLDIKRIAHKGIRLRRLEKFDLDTLYLADWTDDIGTPQAYFVDLDPNNRKYRLFPIPTAADAGAYLSVEYIKIPPALSNDTDVPLDSHALLGPYHMALAYWTASQLMRQNPNEARMAKIRLYDVEYDKLVSHCIETFKQMADTTPMRIRGGRYFKEFS